MTKFYFVSVGITMWGEKRIDVRMHEYRIDRETEKTYFVTHLDGKGNEVGTSRLLKEKYLKEHSRYYGDTTFGTLDKEEIPSRVVAILERMMVEEANKIEVAQKNIQLIEAYLKEETK